MKSFLKSPGRMFPFSGLLIMLIGAGILLTPFMSGCSGKKGSKSTKTASGKKGKKTAKGGTKKTAAKKGGKAAAKKSSSIPAVFTKLTSYEGISLDAPFEAGENEHLVKIDPSMGIRIYDTKKLPEGKIVLDTVTLRIIRIETKKQYETEQEATAAYEERKAALEKSISLPPMAGMNGISFTEMAADGKGRSLQLIHSGRTVQEKVFAQAMPKTVVSAGKPIQGLFGLALGKPIPQNMVDERGIVLFLPDNPREEFTEYSYFNDENLNVHSITVKSDPARKFSFAEALAVVRLLEEMYSMKMSYDGESTTSGVFRYSRAGRMLELRWKDGKLTVSARISLPGEKN